MSTPEVTVAELDPDTTHFEFRLYITGQSPQCVRAIENLRLFCDEHLAGRFHVEIIDLLQHPHFARGDEIVAVPTLVRALPEPKRRIIGDLSNPVRLREILGLAPVPAGDD